MEAPRYTDDHSEAVKKFNDDARARHAAGEAEPDLSEENLLATARRETGLEDFGENENFRPALRALLHSLETEAQLNPFGRFRARSFLLAPLKNRLWATACFKEHPEILERKIVAPICIVGAHRSGTTRMHRMMSCDQRLQHLKTWEGVNPAPRLHTTPDNGLAAREQEVRNGMELRNRMYPVGIQAHPMSADWAEEEMLLLNHAFMNFQFFGNFPIPSFYQYFLHADKTHAYEYMVKLMKLISWSRNDPEDKRWILKNPQHMMNLELLFTMFPDAKMVFAHRDPVKALASTLSLMWNFAKQHSDRPLREPVKQIWGDFCLEGARRCMVAQKNVPPSQLLNVYYAQMSQDWRGVMRRIYEFAGIEFTSQAEQALGDWLVVSEKENFHGGHTYSLEDFGLSAAEVGASMQFVRDEYGIAPEL